MVKYTLTYFEHRGLGEVARLLFAYAGVEFTDNRITREEWAMLKPDTPTGRLPILDVDGFSIVESFAIYEFLARRFGLAGADEFEQATALSVVHTFRDRSREARPYMEAVAGRGTGDKEELYKTVCVPLRDFLFPYIQSVLDKSGSGFVVKSGVTWADLSLAESIQTIMDIDPEFEKHYPKIVEYQKRVYSLPQIKNYIETRPDLKYH